MTTRYMVWRELLERLAAVDLNNRAELSKIQSQAKQLVGEGPDNVMGAARKKALQDRLARVAERDALLLPIILKLWREEDKSLREIAAALLKMGHKPPRGEHWSPATINQILKRGGYHS
jgi:predicted transcriptional regulator